MEENKKSIFKKKEVWISGIIGIIIGIALFYALQFMGIGAGNKIIATSKAGSVKEGALYKQMKKSYPVSYVLELIDRPILTQKYKLTKEQEEEINSQVSSILSQYASYGYTEDQFFEENGFENKEDFIDYMKLDYRRNLYCTDYFKNIISQDKIDEYYNNNEIYGTISTKHILVQISDTVTEEQALAKANEIIGKLNSGKTFDEVSSEYEETDVTEEVNFDSFEAANYAVNYVNASKTLEVGAYTKEAVKTDYGYHVIYCTNKEEKPTLDQAKDKIVQALEGDLEEEDQYIRYKALIKLREEYKIKFKDKNYEKQYQEYCDQINGKEE